MSWCCCACGVSEEALGGYDLSAPSWVEQSSTAIEVMAGYEARTLSPEDEVFVPWAVRHSTRPRYTTYSTGRGLMSLSFFCV